MAASPIPDIIELINQHLRPYDPDNGHELWTFLQELPDLFEALSSAALCVGQHIAEKPGEMQTVAERLDTIENLMDSAKEVAEETRDDFRRVNEFWIEGSES